MKPEIIAILFVFLTFLVIEAIKTGLFSKTGQTRDDGIVEWVSALSLLIVIQPGIILATNSILGSVAPSYAGSLSDTPIILQILLLLVFDDMTQYWWHRLSHSVPLLYKLHRPHHNASYMSVRLVYRNSLLYYTLMPGIWFSAVLVYLGLGWVYAFYLVSKLTVITGAHCDWQWDAKLYKIKSLDKVMWLVERIISTPATHSAHHGKHAADGVTNYKGNFGNMLFLWDVLFGTAKITRQRPPEYGVEDLPDTDYKEQLFWPFISRGTSAIHVKTADQQQNS